MDLLRTPDARFESLPGPRFAPHYVEVSAGDQPVRMHYVDEGPRDGRVVLMLHGEPSWSFLYRKVIAVVVAQGFRAIAPDLVGFGRSDKPSHGDDYTYARHVAWMASFLERADVREATLLGQDWGGLIGLRLVAEHPERFSSVVAANTMLPTGDRKMPPAFFAWQQYSQTVPELHAGGIVKSACARELSADVIAAYDAPFPDESYKAGARRFPMLVPSSPDDPAAPANRRAWGLLGEWKKPFLTAFGDSDPITQGGDRVLQKHVPGAAGQPHVTLKNAGHFLQEDVGEELGELVCRFVRTL